MTLLTVEELREHLETALGNDALQRVLSSCEQAITAWAGPLDWDPYEDTVEDVTEIVHNAPFERVLQLRRAPVAVTTVTDRVATTENEFTEDADFRVWDRYLIRPTGYYWGDRTTVEYEPPNDGATRRTVLIQMCQLELNFQPGMASQGAGPWSESYSNYRRQRRELLQVIRPPDPPVMQSVPMLERA